MDPPETSYHPREEKFVFSKFSSKKVSAREHFARPKTPTNIAAKNNILIFSFEIFIFQQILRNVP
jgi:hypothetical protein